MIVIGELDWSPGVHEQAIGRVWRDGQENSVSAYFMVSTEGSDPFMVEALDLKERQIDGLRNPDQIGPIERLQIDPERIKEMARRYLNRKAGNAEDRELSDSAESASSADSISDVRDVSGDNDNDIVALPTAPAVPYTLSLFD